MAAKKTMAYFLLLLGPVAIAGDAGSVRSAKEHCAFMTDPETTTDKAIEEYCLTRPELAAIADDLTGSADYKKKEIIAQCHLFNRRFFIEDFPDFETLKNGLRQRGKDYANDETMYDEGIASCDSSLLQSYQVYEYVQCVTKYCEEA